MPLPASGGGTTRDGKLPRGNSTPGIGGKLRIPTFLVACGVPTLLPGMMGVGNSPTRDDMPTREMCGTLTRKDMLTRKDVLTREMCNEMTCSNMLTGDATGKGTIPGEVTTDSNDAAVSVAAVGAPGPGRPRRRGGHAARRAAPGQPPPRPLHRQQDARSKAFLSCGN